MGKWENGIAADQILGARWQKAKSSDALNDCIEVARLTQNEYAIRNSRFPDGPALIYTQAEFDAFVDGVGKGEFSNMPV
ncbi:DUF397 domain-containing protein [Streptomyces sp. CMB-StM0423]|uniref:DUF397 domain-containing protein n=1 Tax=Streptomyces sp. CMB-StM0423 TaxID=2059884 RepID=UPI000C70929C|nr:DUF397 domain-containing protein [Streptomyces sp. CMB-StM0423]AUH40547.1 DUF397 domain-containing protein [Streptomyces sp. CMB-StM0423]